MDEYEVKLEKEGQSAIPTATEDTAASNTSTSPTFALDDNNNARASVSANTISGGNNIDNTSVRANHNKYIEKLNKQIQQRNKIEKEHFLPFFLLYDYKNQKAKQLAYYVNESVKLRKECADLRTQLIRFEAENRAVLKAKAEIQKLQKEKEGLLEKVHTQEEELRVAEDDRAVLIELQVQTRHQSDEIDALRAQLEIKTREVGVLKSEYVTYKEGHLSDVELVQQRQKMQLDLHGVTQKMARAEEYIRALEEENRRLYRCQPPQQSCQNNNNNNNNSNNNNDKEKMVVASPLQQQKQQQLQKEEVGRRKEENEELGLPAAAVAAVAAVAAATAGVSAIKAEEKEETKKELPGESNNYKNNHDSNNNNNNNALSELSEQTKIEKAKFLGHEAYASYVRKIDFFYNKLQSVCQKYNGNRSNHYYITPFVIHDGKHVRSIVALDSGASDSKFHTASTAATTNNNNNNDSNNNNNNISYSSLFTVGYDKKLVHWQLKTRASVSKRNKNRNSDKSLPCSAERAKYGTTNNYFSHNDGNSGEKRNENYDEEEEQEAAGALFLSSDANSAKIEKIKEIATPSLPLCLQGNHQRYIVGGFDNGSIRFYDCFATANSGSNNINNNNNLFSSFSSALSFREMELNEVFGSNISSGNAFRQGKLNDAVGNNSYAAGENKVSAVALTATGQHCFASQKNKIKIFNNNSSSSSSRTTSGANGGGSGGGGGSSTNNKCIKEIQVESAITHIEVYNRPSASASSAAVTAAAAADIFFTGHSNGTVMLWDRRTCVPSLKLAQVHVGEVCCVSYADNYAAASHDTTTTNYNPNHHNNMFMANTSAYFHNYFISTGKDSNVVIRDVRQPTKVVFSYAPPFLHLHSTDNKFSLFYHSDLAGIASSLSSSLSSPSPASRFRSNCQTSTHNGGEEEEEKEDGERGDTNGDMIKNFYNMENCSTARNEDMIMALGGYGGEVLLFSVHKCIQQGNSHNNANLNNNLHNNLYSSPSSSSLLPCVIGSIEPNMQTSNNNLKSRNNCNYNNNSNNGASHKSLITVCWSGGVLCGLSAENTLMGWKIF